MKHTICYILVCLITCLPKTTTTAELRGKTFLNIRSQSANLARDMVGWQEFIYTICPQGFYSALSITPEYMQSFRSQKLAGYFFATDTLTISGSQVDNRGENDILADYFGLSPAFKSSVLLRPELQSGLIDFSMYAAYNTWYIRAHAPFVWIETKIPMEETISFPGSDSNYPAQYMAATEVVPPAQSFKQAISGTVPYGQVTEPLQFGKIGCPSSIHKFSEPYVICGWNFVNRTRGTAGLQIRFGIPTGNRPTAEFLFEPIVGNGHHWEFGAGFSGHGTIWEVDSNHHFDLYAEIVITHLFSDQQLRSFDFNSTELDCPFDNDLFGSRYILIKEFEANGLYAGKTIPAINRTTLCCDVSTRIQFDAVAMFAYIYKNYTINFGYEGWVRSKDSITLKECFPEMKFGLKGISNATDALGNNNSDTQSNATLHGNNFSNQASVIDNPSPVFISSSDIDVSSGEATMGFTHKIFAHFSHSWNKQPCQKMTPFLGLGGEVEFDGDQLYRHEQDNNNSISLWGVWIKTGFAF